MNISAISLGTQGRNPTGSLGQAAAPVRSKSSNPELWNQFQFFNWASPTVSAVGGNRGPHCCFSADREVGMHSKFFKDWMWTKNVPYASVLPKSTEEIIWAEFHSCPSAEFLLSLRGNPWWVDRSGESTGLRPSSSSMPSLVVAALWGSEAQSQIRMDSWIWMDLADANLPKDSSRILKLQSTVSTREINEGPYQ